MSWSYSGDPANSDSDHLRFLVQDTDEAQQLLSDEEITHLLSEASADVRKAAGEAARVVSRRFARQADTATPELQVSFSRRAETYADLAADLLAEPSTGASEKPEIAAPATIAADKAALVADTTITAPTFSQGMHDFPGT
jgi:hypothetical protein